MVAGLRDRFDPAAKLGMPAHITLAFPFMPPETVSPAVLQRLQGIANRFTTFDYSLAGVGRFPRAAYLEPVPAAPFIALTQAVFQAFPQHPPNTGSSNTVVPHVTVANGSADAADAVQTELLGALGRHGSVRATCRSLTLFENGSGFWRPMHVFALAGVGEKALAEQK